jgi:hypothetical protein
MYNININQNAHPVSHKKRPDLTTAARSVGWPRMESRLVRDPMLSGRVRPIIEMLPAKTRLDDDGHGQSSSRR